MADSERCDVHRQINGQFIEAMLVVAKDNRCPWHSRGDHLHLPRNVASGRAYQGINILALWAAGILRDYPSGTVGTRRQWRAAGVEVFAGEKPTIIARYRDARPGRDKASGNTRGRLIATACPVFFVEQTDAYTPVFMDDPPCETEIIEAGEAYLAGSRARIFCGGGRARYDPDRDIIHLPPRGTFRGTPTSTPVQSFYATALHELGHWSGAKGRLGRSLGKRCGDDAEAAEELVAELFAAFTCAAMGIANEPRPDHVRHHRSWLRIMQADRRALFRAAAAASSAVRYVDALQPVRPDAAARLRQARGEPALNITLR